MLLGQPEIRIISNECFVKKKNLEIKETNNNPLILYQMKIISNTLNRIKKFSVFSVVAKH